MVARPLAVDDEAITARAQLEDDSPGITAAGPVKLRNAGHARTRRE